MASLLLRRSGVAVGAIAELLEWQADTLYQVGIGMYHKEVDVLRHEWGENLKVIGCEPHPRIRLEDYPGEVYRVAIANRVGQTSFYARPGHKDGSSLYKRDGEEFTEYTVKVTTLDALFPNPEGPRILLWLDCEGAELDALKGGENFLKHVDVINVELTAKSNAKEWCSPGDVHDLLQSRGFFRQWIHTHRVNAGQADAIYVCARLFRPQFCCCPCQVKKWQES
jgi:FkbM family methyltransferase